MAAPEKKQETENKKPVPLTEPRIQESSFMRTSWFVTAQPNTKVSDLLDVEFWRHVASKFKPLDIIEAVTEDGLWYARLLVVSCDRVWAKVKLLEEHDLTAEAKEMPTSSNDDYVVKWKGPLAKYCVVRKSDGITLKDGLTSQLDGLQWLEGHLKSLAA